jgi:uncharacterized integral membrane protein
VAAGGAEDEDDPRVERGKELGRWLGYTIAFEALGFGLAFAGGNLVHGVWMRASGASLDDDMPLWLTLALALVVGGLEGASLGSGQWLVLRRRFANLSGSSWAGATALGGGLAWALGMGLGGRVFTMPPPLWLMATLMVVSGLIFGGLLGGAQWLVLRRHVARGGRAWRWPLANAVGWTIGLLAVYAATSFIDESTPVLVTVLITVPAGATMAIVPALVTGLTLRDLPPGRRLGKESKLRA